MKVMFARPKPGGDIQEAIDWLGARGGTVELYPGVYTVHNLRVPEGVKIIGVPSA